MMRLTARLGALRREHELAYTRLKGPLFSNLASLTAKIFFSPVQNRLVRKRVF